MLGNFSSSGCWDPNIQTFLCRSIKTSLRGRRGGCWGVPCRQPFVRALVRGIFFSALCALCCFMALHVGHGGFPWLSATLLLSRLFASLIGCPVTCQFIDIFYPLLDKNMLIWISGKEEHLKFNHMLRIMHGHDNLHANFHKNQISGKRSHQCSFLL